MPGKGGLYGDLGGFKVTDFADHDHVRVLAQYGAQGFGKAQVDLGINLCLANARQLVLNRVFYRHDVAGVRVEPLQGRVQRGGFTRTRGAGHQNNAVRLRDKVLKPVQHIALHANRFQAQLAFAFIEQTQHGTLAVGAWQGADAHIDGACADAQ